MIRLQRRPLRKGPEFDELKTVKLLRRLEVRDLSRLVGMAQTCLDITGKSICMMNIKLILKDAKTVVPLQLTLRGPI